MKNLVGMVLAAGAMFILMPLAGGAPAATAGAPATGEAESMPEKRFWALVDASTRQDSDAQAAALRASLEELPVAQIEEFERVFAGKMRESHSWDLWGAAYVVHGGASDDGFEYFRCWLISKGHRVFDKVVADPDSLADLLPPDPGGPLEFEEFAYVAREVWAAKTGRNPGDMPGAADMIYPERAPSGQPFQDDAASLAARYPKLWRRFGSNPIS